MRTAVLAATYRAAQFPVWSALFWSPASIAVAGFFLRGAAELRARTPVRWGGREYVLEPADD